MKTQIKKILSTLLLSGVILSSVYADADTDYVDQQVDNMRASKLSGIETGIFGEIFMRLFDDNGKIKEAFYSFVGTATEGYVPRWQSNHLVDSPIYTDGTNVDMSGNLNVVGTITAGNIDADTLDGIDSTGFLQASSVTSGVYDDATSDAPYTRLNLDSFHTNGLGVGQMYIEGRAIDSNSQIEIGRGVAGGQSAQDIYLGDSNEIFVDTSANNVGIGTLGPSEKLEIAGNVKTSGEYISTNINQARYVYGNYGVIHRNDGGNYYILSTAAGDQYGSWNTFRPFNFSLSTGNVYIGNSNLYVENGGNVGIGTTSPDQKLTVKGGGIGFDNNSVDKKLYSPTDGVLEWMTHDSATTHGFAVSHQGTQRVYLNTNGDSYLNGGNVGIGTTLPSEKLEVSGNTLINGNLTANKFLWKGGIHQINNNDGGGNVNIRFGNEYNAGTFMTQNGGAIHLRGNIDNSTDPSFQIYVSNGGQSTGDAVSWGATYTFGKVGLTANNIKTTCIGNCF